MAKTQAHRARLWLGRDDRQPALGDRAWIEQASPMSTEDAPFSWSAPQQPIVALLPFLFQHLEIINANGMPFSILKFPQHQIFPCIDLPADAAPPTLVGCKLAPTLCAGKRLTCHPAPSQPNRYGYYFLTPTNNFLSKIGTTYNKTM
ncbi:hypothetical protein [Ralstonia solanacearum]|uniref:hypothetical protein n=1 Tax=Ralstonia solanacearum TaxID=305 RepID=UPI0012DA1E95|nr:hypothetical protein [Ralstonia solanacearum]